MRPSAIRFSGTLPSTTWCNGWASPRTAGCSTSSHCRATSARSLGVFADFSIPEEPSCSISAIRHRSRSRDLVALEDLLKSTLVAALAGRLSRDRPERRGQGCAALPGQLRFLPRLDRSDGPQPQGYRGDERQRDRPQLGRELLHAHGPSGKLNGVNANFVPFTAKIPPVASADTMLSNEVTGVILGGYKQAPPDEFRQLSFRTAPSTGIRPAVVRQGAKYKGRPLNGIWATAPYLHNGSVPNLDALLQPAAKRPTSFSIGVRTFDPVHVGFLTDVPGFPDSTSITRTARRSRQFQRRP